MRRFVILKTVKLSISEFILKMKEYFDFDIFLTLESDLIKSNFKSFQFIESLLYLALRNTVE